MIDVTQFVLIFVVVSLTVVLLIIGFQTVSILKEFRHTIRKINKILEDTGIISESVAKPVSAFSEFLLGVRKGVLLPAILRILKKRTNKNKKEEEEE